MIYFCCDERRRNAVRNLPTDAFNGIDFLEVLGHAAENPEERQRVLQIHFVRPPSASQIDGITPDHVVIEGGVRVTGIRAIETRRELVESEPILKITVNNPGDFSTYTVRLVERDGGPLAWLDAQLSSIDFAFKIECIDDVDCRSSQPCPPEPRQQPHIDYLAKDYASFRQLMLDRLSLLVPSWRAETPADTGITLVELLAYVGDYLSYQQDAIATEAYLGTARRRASVRRHARLVDYAMHDGCNARVWLHLIADRAAAGADFPGQVAAATERPLALTRVPGLDSRMTPESKLEERSTAIAAGHTECFEPMHAVKLHHAHNELHFHSWGQQRCVLPRGATRATLQDPERRVQLRPGDALLLEEVLGPRSGRAADADPSHRHIVRLTQVKLAVDPLAGRFNEPPDDTSLAVLEIEWAKEDALPFPLCLSSITDVDEGADAVPVVSVARGNMVLFDHGRSVLEPSLGSVPSPDPRLASPVAASAKRCASRDPIAVPPRYQPSLREGPLTQAAPAPRAGSSAAAAFVWSMDEVLPAITLLEDAGHARNAWRPRRDLLASAALQREFVAEVDASRPATIRFGDDTNGARPTPGSSFAAEYRVGNGVRGNVGAESIVHLVTVVEEVLGVRNPLPARRGMEAETIEHVRQTAPAAFRKQQRAVTPEDYAEVAQRHPEVQRAVASLRWTGSWRTLYLSIDRIGGRPVDAAFVEVVRDHLEGFRMAGHDLEIHGPRYVPLELTLHVCVRPDYFRSDVKGALLEVLSSIQTRDGRRGVFHPDNFTFGQPVYLSSIYAAAQVVPGVSSLRIQRLQRLGVDDPTALERGVLEIGRLEVAQLDNDPNFPERGSLRLILEGGR